MTRFKVIYSETHTFDEDIEAIDALEASEFFVKKLRNHEIKPSEQEVGEYTILEPKDAEGKTETIDEGVDGTWSLEERMNNRHKQS